MAIHEYECPDCGRFDRINGGDDERCPVCGELSRKLISAPARIIVNHRENLPYGNKSRGRMIKADNGTNILIPSWGALEKEEVDYLAEAALEKERTRKPRQSRAKRKLENLAKLALMTPQGKRAKTLQEVL